MFVRLKSVQFYLGLVENEPIDPFTKPAAASQVAAMTASNRCVLARGASVSKLTPDASR